MDIPITNPHLSANLEDNSKVDDSFKQQGTTVNLGNGATYNQNCGNKREMSRAMSTIIGVLFSFTCDIFIIGCLIFSFDKLCEKLQDFDRDVTTKFEKVEKRAAETHKDIMKKIQQWDTESTKTHADMMKSAKEGTIWLLRDDLLKSMDFYEASKVISQKQYKRIKDEYEYYTSIGGNHDVKDRWDNFNTKLYGLGEIKMVQEIPARQ